METVRRLPCNWKRIDDWDFIETVEYAPVEPMRRADCRGEVRLYRLVYLTPCLLSSRLCRHCCLPVLRGKQRERERAKAQRKKGEGGGRVLTAFVAVIVFFDG